MIEVYTPPTPIAAPSCPACRTFAPECVIPGEMLNQPGAGVPMCWLCAHAVIEHGGTLDDAHERVAACKCSAHDIYPADVIARRAATIYTHQTPSETGREIAIHAATVAHVARTGGMTARERTAQNRRSAEARWKP